MTDKVMNYRIRYLIFSILSLSVCPQSLDPAGLQHGQSPVRPLIQAQEPGLSLTVIIITSGFVQESKVKEHGKSPDGDQKVRGQSCGCLKALKSMTVS